ncbi:right-handed parallel beta-helix repeat-containing protein [Candidatus Woesearchaeota archaeon]|nr:right-handed parallel beta-helix repeat-containing protein [Candidatus Woesearchaeota archaeon]
MQKRGEPGFLLAALAFALMFFFALTEPVSRGPTGAFTVETDVSACGSLVSANNTLVNNVSSADTCFTVSCDNCFLDCDGYTITFDTAGGGSDQGITATSRNNVTVRNCNVRDGNGDGLSGYGIKFSDTNNSIVSNNNVFTNGTSINLGIQVSDSMNTIVTGNNVTTSGSGSSNYGIDIILSTGTSSGNNVTDNIVRTGGTLLNVGIRLAASNNTVTGNNITTGGSSTLNHGIILTSGSDNTVTANTITTNGTDSNHGIRLQSASDNNAFFSNNITTRGTGSYGISILASNGSRFNNTILDNPVAWVSLGVGTFNNFTNMSFVTNNGSMRLPGRIQLNGTLDMTRAKLNITFNHTFLNSTNLSQLNQSAFIALNGLAFIDPQPVVDLEDSGTFTACPAETCTETSYTGGVFVFNVSHFTSFATAETVSACGTLASANNTLVNNVSSADTCFTVSCDNCFLDCAGFTITYASSSTGYGVNVSNRNNVTVRDCHIDQGDSGVTGAHAVFFSNTTNGTIRDNVANATGSASFGLYLASSSTHNTLSNNTVLSPSVGIRIESSANNTATHNRISGTLGTGIYVSSSSNSNITNNTATGSSGNGMLIEASSNSNIINNTATGPNVGIRLDTGSNLNTLMNNVAAGNGSYGGIYLSGSSNNTLDNNRGSSTNLYGITLDGSSNYNMLSNNTATSNSSNGLLITSSSNFNVLTNNTASSNSGTGVNIASSTSNVLRNTTIRTNATWLSTNSGASDNNITNLLFDAPDGSVLILPTVTVPISTTVNHDKLNVSFNRSFMNSTALSFLNTSARIVLQGLSFSNPSIVVDANDTGTFASCDASQCTQGSYAGGVLVFNVSHFTSYAITEGPPVCGNISTSTTLLNNVTSAGLCFNLTADNLVLDCDGYTITFDTGGVGADAGVAAVARNNVTVKNCNIRDTNAAGSQGVGINFTGTNSSIIFNNTIRTNGTSNNYGILLRGNSNHDAIENNTVTAIGSTSGNNGIYLLTSASNNNVTGNTITTNGTSSNRGIQIEDSSNSTVRNNTIYANGTGAGNEGIRLVINARGSILVGNTITTSGTTTNYGVELSSGSNETTVANNTMYASGTSGFNVGIRLATENNLIENNTITTNGTTDNHGIRASVSGTIASLALNNTIRNNRISAGGTSISHGIQLESGSYNNTIAANTITANGTQSYAISLQNANGTVFNDTLLENPAQWINATPSTNNNFTNTTFKTGNGSIRFPGTLQNGGALDITMTKLNITANRAFLNSTNLTLLNTSAQIKLNNITGTNPQPLVDSDDDGVFEACSESQCVEDGFAEGVFTFTVTGFTAYSSRETPEAAATSTGGTAGEQPTVRYDDCIPSWTCEEWSACQDGMRTRDCVDRYGCGVASPATEQACAMPIEEKPVPVPVTPEERPAQVPELPAEQGIPWALVIAIGLALLALIALSIRHRMRSRKTRRRA